MKHPRHWLRRPLAAGTALALTLGLLAFGSPAAAAGPPPPAYAAGLPDLSTPRVAHDYTLTRSAKGVAARGADGSLLYSTFSGGVFGPFQSLGGVIVGDPNVVVTSYGTEFYVRGTDDQVYTNTITPSGVVTGYSIVPGLRVTGEVEAIVAFDEPPASVKLFARGTDGAVWTNVRRNGAWVGWRSLGGFATSDITASRGFFTLPFNVRVFVRGSDNRVYFSNVSANTATAFEPIGDLRVTSNIAVRDDFGINAYEIAARGEDNRVWTMNLVTIGATWQPLDGLTATSDIALATNFLYVRGPDNAVYAYRRDRVVGYERVDGEATGNPAAFATAPNGGPHDQTLLARLTSGALATNFRPYVNGQPAGQFGGYTTIAGPPVD
ncbi:hypothetical protein ACIBF7_42265 [Nonomuraea sp. NPDC050478]|uniref:hypothetical protein n=1 Tax=Nonomuraea sp. NPDC050478 TaxID=3364365 RepID=UPI0037AE7ABE